MYTRQSPATLRRGDAYVPVLGPSEASREGGRLDLGGARQRALLGLLVAAAPQRVSIDALITGLWGPDASVFIAGCHLNLAAVIPSDNVGLLLRLAEAETSQFQIDVAPEFRDRVPDRDSGLRRYRPYPE